MEIWIYAEYCKLRPVESKFRNLETRGRRYICLDRGSLSLPIVSYNVHCKCMWCGCAENSKSLIDFVNIRKREGTVKLCAPRNCIKRWKWVARLWICALKNARKCVSVTLSSFWRQSKETWSCESLRTMDHITSRISNKLHLINFLSKIVRSLFDGNLLSSESVRMRCVEWRSYLNLQCKREYKFHAGNEFNYAPKTFAELFA